MRRLLLRESTQLGEDYLLDSDASVQAVVGLNIEYGKKGSRKATLSAWRARVFHTAAEDELRVVKEIADWVGYNYGFLLLLIF